MTHESTDLRIARTRRLLQAALIELTMEHGFDTVTVGEIAGRAGVNRATFYRHYQDKYDLVEKMFHDAIGRFSSTLGPPGEVILQIVPQNPPERWVKLFEHFAEHERLYRALLGKNGSSWFASKMREQMIQLVAEREQMREQLSGIRQDASQTRVPRKVAIMLASNLFITTVTWWLESGQPYSPRQMAGWMLDFAINGYVSVLGL